MIEDKQIDKKTLKVSILGDSISTYEGYNPYGYEVYYKADAAYENGITSVNDTWWWQVIDSLDGELCVNNSFSGSFLSDGFAMSGCCEGRCSFLHKGDDKPDIILVYMGTNDRGYGVEIGLDKPDNLQCFYGGYRAMLRRLKRNYPLAKIVCSTLPIGYKRDYKNVPTAPEVLETVERYNEAIRLAVREEGCLLADSALSGERYETLDFCHPTAQGHNTLARLWMENYRR